MKSWFRTNPDVVALAMIIVLILAVPMVGAAKPKLQVMYASNRVTERSLMKLEQRGQRVWQRLEERMRRFEEKFDSVAAPTARPAACTEIDSE